MMILIIFFLYAYILKFSFSTETDLSNAVVPSCNYISLQNSANRTAINCPFYMGNLVYNKQNFFICPNQNHSFINLYTLDEILNSTYYPDINRTFMAGDTCKQLLADNSNILICSNQNSLIQWDLSTGSLIRVYNDFYWSIIPGFKPISESISTLIVVEDGLVVKLIDIIKCLEIKNFGAGVNFTKSVIMQKSNLLGIHYNYKDKKFVEIWDLSNILKKFVWDVDLTYCISVYLNQKQYILGYKNNLLKKWDFLLSQNWTITLSNNNVTMMSALTEVDGQIKNILISFQNDVLILLDSSSSSQKAIIEKYPNSYTNLIDGTYDSYTDLLMIQSSDYFLYNISNYQTYKLLDLDLTCNVLYFSWNSLNKAEFFIIFKKNSLIYLEKWDTSICEPIDLMKSPYLSFKIIVQLTDSSESLLLMVGQDNVISLYSPYSKATTKTFNSYPNAVFLSAMAISCPNHHLIILNGYINNQGTNQYRLFLLNLNTSQITLALSQSFNSSINSLIYLNYRDFIAFENEGIIYIYDIVTQNYINSIVHNLNGLTYMISLKNFPYILATSIENFIYYWNIYDNKMTTWSIVNASFSNANIQLLQDMALTSYKGIELIAGVWSLSSNLIISFWDVSNGNLIFQLNDSRTLSLTYKNFLLFSKNNIDYLLILTDLTNDIWNLNTQTLEKTFYLPKTHNSIIEFQSSETFIFDISNNVIALWDLSLPTNQINQNYFFCKQGYFFQNLTDDCEKCDSLCYSNCYGFDYDQCVTPKCNYLFEKSDMVVNLECFDCSLDSYFLVDHMKCMNFSNIFTNNAVTTYCFGCLDGFYFSKTACLPCSSNCKNCYGPLKEQCLVCSSDYVLYNSVCYKKIEDDSELPLMIVFGIALGFIAVLAILYLIKMLIDERCCCIITQKFWKCMTSLFFDDKFTATKEKDKSTMVVSNDQSQNVLVQMQEVEVIFPNSNSERLSRRTPSSNTGYPLDHYNLLINSVNRFKGKIMETKDTSINRTSALKLSSTLINEIKEELPFFLYELIDVEQEFNKNNYFQIKIIKKICDSAYGPVFLGEKLCKTRFAIKIFFDNVDQMTLKKINKFLYFLSEQEKIKYNSLQKISPVVAMVYSSTKTNFCMGVMEEYSDYNLDNFLLKTSKSIHFIQKLDITLQILDSVKSLHDINLSHRNIKANNILINSEDINYSINIKISDFSKYMKLSTLMYSYKSLQTNAFQLAYIPPEYFNKKSYGNSSKSSDIWSIGIVIYDIFYPDDSHSLDLPWIQVAEELTEKYKKEGALTKFNNIYRSELLIEKRYCKEDPLIRKEITDIINDCLKVDINKRIEIHEMIWKVQWLKMKSTKE